MITLVKYLYPSTPGTLTQNIMTFNKCTINGVSYGDILDATGEPLDLDEVGPLMVEPFLSFLII